MDEVDSTNDLALEMARRGDPEGTVVTARTQRKGRGRLGRKWWDKPGESAILSVLLRPPESVTEPCQLALLAGLAVAECLEREQGPQVALKWPNDVLVRGKKVAGVLVETRDRAVVVGIGINLNQTDFPPQIARTATSLRLETGRVYEPKRLVKQVAETLFGHYDKYLAFGFEEILGGWRKYMWGLGKQAAVQIGDETLNGRIVGVDHRGNLLMVDVNGREHAVVAADSIQLI